MMVFKKKVNAIFKNGAILKKDVISKNNNAILKNDNAI